MTTRTGLGTTSSLLGRLGGGGGITPCSISCLRSARFRLCFSFWYLLRCSRVAFHNSSFRSFLIAFRERPWNFGSVMSYLMPWYVRRFGLGALVCSVLSCCFTFSSAMAGFLAPQRNIRSLPTKSEPLHGKPRFSWMIFIPQRTLIFDESMNNLGNVCCLQGLEQRDLPAWWPWDLYC